MFKINNEKLLDEAGLSFDTMEDLLFYVSRHLEWLKKHNRNYNAEQWFRICDLKDIFDCIEIE